MAPEWETRQHVSAGVQKRGRSLRTAVVRSDRLKYVLNIWGRGGQGPSDSLREGKPKLWRKVRRDASDAGPNCRELETCLGDDGTLLRKARQKHLLKWYTTTPTIVVIITNTH